MQGAACWPAPSCTTSQISGEPFGMSTEIISADRPAAVDGLPAERRGWAAAAIFTALAMASLDTAIANIALPATATALQVSPAAPPWVMHVYQPPFPAPTVPLPHHPHTST